MRLDPVISSLLPKEKHGFFTRKGGGSEGVFHTLNCGFGSFEDPGIVRQNRALIAASFNIPSEQLFSAKQIHSARVITISDPEASSPALLEREADALVSDRTGIALSVLTADCAPVLFFDREKSIIGAAHAGWRGAINGVLEATVDAMRALGARPDRISAVIGPCISQKNYEVGAEFLETFLDTDQNFSQYFINGANGKYLFDLPSFALHKLRSMQLEICEWVGECTYETPEKFYSYRYAQHKKLPNYGRMLSVITN
ncbi:MAG: peptidoglycan editing factor PgeF [Rhodobacteraceae bacterium]|nr:peptidoglycan editing factor PgeF [Paracoccaceae bacterium]